MKVGTQNLYYRENWLEATLQNVPASSRILDAGAGEQQYKRFCTHLEYVAQDFALYDGKGDAKGLQRGSWDQSRLDIISDIISIPEPDASFDAIMCIEVLEHLSNPLPALAEFSRLIKPGGELILTAPFCSLTHFAPYHFITGYNRYFYEKHLPDMGFDIVEMTANGNFFEYIAQEILRIESVSKRFCGKVPNWLEKLSIKTVLKMLQKFSVTDRGSEELLCYGYHILAKKV
jgi:ubiquinone/menaquinone biosynthesis C-methylase UbiE